MEVDMRNPIVWILGAAIVVLLGATTVFYQKLQTSTASYASLKTEEHEARIRYGEAINAIAAIQDSLDDIVVAGEDVKFNNEYNNEARLTENQGDEILARISEIKAGIERSKVRIEELDARLKKSNMKVAGLEKMVANLKKDVAEKEAMVTELTAKVESLQGEVTGLTAQVQSNQETIQQNEAALEEKRRELGTIYYTIGSKKELTESGVVVAKGGVLGVGKTLKPTGQVTDGFIPLDTDYQTVLHIPAKEAQVLSAQPATSYQMQTVGTELELRITNPEEFRKVKHLVIIKT
jgi:peptidoglycan hydrolase CwlO-like protein